MELPTEQKPQNNGQPVTRWFAVSFVVDVVLSVAIPTTAFALLGRWADRHWNLSPWMTIIGLVLAVSVAYLLIMRKAREYLEILHSSKKN